MTLTYFIRTNENTNKVWFGLRFIPIEDENKLLDLRDQLSPFLRVIKQMFTHMNADTTCGQDAEKIRLLQDYCKQARNTASSDILPDLINEFAQIKLTPANHTLMLDHQLLLNISMR